MTFEAVSQMATSADVHRKTEKSQEELRVILEQKLKSIKPAMEKGMKAYEKALKEGVFEDQDGEPEGTGEGRKEIMQEKLVILLDHAEKMKGQLESKETLPQVVEALSATYTHPDGTQETITFNLEQKLQEFLSFYQKTKLDLPADFEDTIQDLWERHQDDIEQAIEQNGFDDILLIPGNIPLPELAEKMKMEKGYYEGGNFTADGSFASALSQNVDKPRIILVHKTQNLKDRPELKQTLNTRGRDVKRDQALTLEDYLVFQRKFFEETNKHLDEDGWTWLATTAGARLVASHWDPGAHQLRVDADDREAQNGSLGVRPSRCFF